MPVISAIQFKQTSGNFKALFFMILFIKINHGFSAVQ